MNRIRLSALLTISGLAVVSVSLFRPHAYLFLLFAMAGAPAIVAGAALFVLSPRQKKATRPPPS
jgi:hypothetical protein